METQSMIKTELELQWESEQQEFESVTDDDVRAYLNDMLYDQWRDDTAIASMEDEQ